MTGQAQWQLQLVIKLPSTYKTDEHKSVSYYYNSHLIASLSGGMVMKKHNK